MRRRLQSDLGGVCFPNNSANTKIKISSRYCEPISLNLGFLADLSKYNDDELRQNLSSIPLLVLHGEYDDVIPTALVEEWFNHSPSSESKSGRFHCVERGDHRLNRSIPFIIDKLSRFLFEI